MDWTLERKRTVHADHATSNKKRGLFKTIICAATSPTKVGLAPALKSVRQQFGDSQFGAISEKFENDVCSVVVFITEVPYIAVRSA